MSDARARPLASAATGLVLSMLLCSSCIAPKPPPPSPARVRVDVSRGVDLRPSPAVAPALAPAPAEPLPSTADAGADLNGEADRRPRLPDIPRLVRVGLATDVAEFHASPGGRAVWLTTDRGVRIPVGSQVTVRPSKAASAAASYRLQVAALKDARQAEELARRLERLTGQPADSVFDAATDLHRVRVGAARHRDDLYGLRRRLAQIGFTDSWIVHEDRGLARAGLVVSVGGADRRVDGRAVFLATGDRQVTYAGRTYRGSLVLFLNERGLINVINQVRFEDYLRAVVPTELGPELYPEIEALKAQTIAARTYVLRNFGEFAAEGYDVCATPRCQVYGGVHAEHPLSDRAVLETRGEVLLYGGELVDALYSSTCGGHTERVEVVFPDKHEAYLRGVPCLEAGLMTLTGDGRGPVSLEALQAGLPEDAVLLESRELFLELRGDELLTHRSGLRRGRLLSDRVSYFRRTADGRTVPAELRVAAGDPMRLFLDRGRLLAVVQDLPFAARTVESPHRDWARFRSQEVVRARVGELYPGFRLVDLEVLRRGVSGRVADLGLIGTRGRRETVSGLAVRWTLDVPDTWFDVKPARQYGELGWRFVGHGWGHGVGMCQIGAFGMAARGVRHEEILDHYYSGVVIERLVEPGETEAGSGESGRQPAD